MWVGCWTLICQVRKSISTQGDTKELVTVMYSNFCTYSVCAGCVCLFEELKLRRQVELLESQLKQTEERLHRQEEHIAVLEKEHISRERNWEKAQLMWEQTQVSRQQVTVEVFCISH